MIFCKDANALAPSITKTYVSTPLIYIRTFAVPHAIDNGVEKIISSGEGKAIDRGNEPSILEHQNPE